MILRFCEVLPQPCSGSSATISLRWNIKPNSFFRVSCLQQAVGYFWNDLHTLAWNPSKPGWLLDPAWHFSAQLHVTLTANFLSAHSETTVGCDQSSYLGTKFSLYTEQTCRECQHWSLLLLKYSMDYENSINTVHRNLHWLPIPDLFSKVPWDAGHKIQNTFPSQMDGCMDPSDNDKSCSWDMFLTNAFKEFN